MTTSKQVYDVARKHLDHKGSHARSYCGMSGGPYCCAFVTMCMQQSGGGKLFYGGKKCTYCPNAIKWAQANLAQVPLYLAMQMDLIFFDWQPNGTPDHIGFVLEKISSDKIRTLEGNTSGGIVAIKTRSGYVQGVFRPHYTPDRALNKSILEVDGDFGYLSIYMMQTALGQTADGILKKSDVAVLQRKVGAAPDGAWGPKTSRLVQSKLCGFKGKDVDGSWGPASTKAFQRWINSACFPATKPTETTPVASTVTKPVVTEKEGYGGTFPTLPTPKIIECTRSCNGMRKHGLLSGDYILRFKSEERRYKMCKFSLATVSNKHITYSNHPKFEDKVKAFGYNLAKVKALKTSANCSNFIDGAVGAVTGKYVRDLGAKHNKSYLAKTNFFTAHKYSKGALLAGDICGTSKHTWMIMQGPVLSIGCEGTEVTKWQNFLRWYGYNITADGDFGMATLKATKDFQSKEKITVDGIVGNGTVNKAKAVKK